MLLPCAKLNDYDRCLVPFKRSVTFRTISRDGVGRDFDRFDRKLT